MEERALIQKLGGLSNLRPGQATYSLGLRFPSCEPEGVCHLMAEVPSSSEGLRITISKFPHKSPDLSLLKVLKHNEHTCHIAHHFTLCFS